MNLGSYPPLSIERFSQALQANGWRSSRTSGPQSLLVETPAGASGVDLHLFERDERRIAVAEPVSIEGDAYVSESLFERFLDLTLPERLVLWAVQGRLAPEAVLFAWPDGLRLFDTALETPLASCPADPDSEDVERCLAPLDPKAKAEALPDAERLAHALTCWFDLLCGRLGRALGWGRSDVERVGRSLMLGWNVARADGDYPLPGFTMTRDADGTVRVAWRGAAADLANDLLRRAQALAPAGAGAFTPIERRALATRLRGLEPAQTACLNEVLHLSAAKFRAPVLLRAFLPIEQEHVSWRLALTEPLHVEHEIAESDLYVFEPMTLDVGEHGAGRALEAIEKLAGYALGQGRALSRAGGRQLDMVETGTRVEATDDDIRDPFNWLCRHALRLRAPAELREPLAHLIASHIADLRSAPPFDQCPRGALTALPSLFAPTIE